MRKPISQLVFGLPVRHLPRAAQRAQQECKAKARARLQRTLAEVSTIDEGNKELSLQATTEPIAEATKGGTIGVTIGNKPRQTDDFDPAIPRLRYSK